jgi:hypothetical protein
MGILAGKSMTKGPQPYALIGDDPQQRLDRIPASVSDKRDLAKQPLRAALHSTPA